MLEQLLQLQVILPICTLVSVVGLVLLAFTFPHSGTLFSSWRGRGYSPVDTDPDYHKPQQSRFDKVLTALGTAARASVRLVRTGAATLAAIYSDSVISVLYPTHLRLENGEPVPDEPDAAKFSWVSPKAWYLAASRW